MECPKCHFDNPTESSFCSKCGTQITPFAETLPSLTETIRAPKKELTTGTLFARRYEVIEELGRGGMGKVYKVFDKKIKDKIALKLIKPEIASSEKTIERFSRELKLARKISHKSVCRMFDISEEEDLHYITMEYVSGEDLKSMIRMMGRLSPGQVVPIARQVCEGLAEAHRLGIVHRDLKPSNIMIDREGQVKIMDFGIARSVEAKGITGTGIMIGTPEYMSPEQVEGNDIDTRSDIYSLGIILYEMLTGRVPFEGNTPLSLALKHKTEAPDDPEKTNLQIPRDLRLLVLRCLEKPKERRYQNADEVLAEFLKIEQGIPTAEKVLPKRKAITSKDITQTFKSRWRLAAAISVMAILAVFAILFLTKEKPAPSPGKKRLAVLPFENIGSPEDEYFADGITDEIIARLTGVKEMSVISRNSAMQYKKTQKTVKQIGEELAADYILSGTIRWQKSAEGTGQVRVTPTLVRTADSTQIWADVYDQPIAEVFGVQSAISKEVVGALGVALLEPEKRSIEAKPTENIEAYDYYLRGNDYFYFWVNRQSFQIAIEMFEKAVALDPDFLQVHAQLTRVNSYYYWLHFDRSETTIAKAKEAVDRALQIDPDAPETNIALGYYYYHCLLDYENALKYLALAKEKQPRNSAIIEGIGYIKRRQGKMDEAASYLKFAAELDPRSPGIAMNLAQTHALLGEYREAERSYERVIFLKPGYAEGYYCKAQLYLWADGNTQKARQVLEEAAQALETLDPTWIIYPWVLVDIFDGRYQRAQERLASVSEDAFSDQFKFIPKTLLSAQIYGLIDQPELERSGYESSRRFLEQRIKDDPEDSRYWSALGIALAGLGQKREAILAAEKAVEILPISKEAYRGTKRTEDLAHVYAMVGEYDEALDILENLLSIPSEMSVSLIKIDPKWGPLRSLPRFQELIKKY